ncbi:OLC1v1003115C1 [Oldenlandia corymbosa var. corymbosa]|nr:OLC1v1003115C1 [Oldenlandia corymbosa var. corymbosa]
MGKKMKNSVEPKKRHLTDTMLQISLKEEILELQQQLGNQFAMRQALEKAICSKPLKLDAISEESVSQSAKDLIEDIAVLELEIAYLEKYLLSMYRKTFAKRLSSPPIVNDKSNLDPTSEKQAFLANPEDTIMQERTINAGHLALSRDSVDSQQKRCDDILGSQVLIDSSIHRSHSSLSHRSAVAARNSPSQGPLAVAEAVESYHSLPLSMLERAQGSGNVGLAGQLGTHVQDHVWETPNRISEEMVKFISAILYQLADPPLENSGFLSSPLSFSPSRSSPLNQHYSWNQQCSDGSVFNSWLDSPLHVESTKEFSFPYPRLAEVKGICRDQQSLNRVEDKMQKFRSLVSTLEFVDPRKMKLEEKLAFWINVHNALVIHAYLVYGIPRGNIKRISLLLKAAYNIGGHNISVEMIQSSILGCRLPRPGQWLQSLFFPRTKSRARDTWKAYATGHQEPRLHFGLCSGSYSDPVLRLYTAKRVFQELEVAKEEYIQTNFRIQKDLKLLLPKKVDSFVKESEMTPSGLMELMEHCLPSFLRENFQQQPQQQGKFWKKIVWVPNNFAFRYLIADELVK